MEIAQAAADPLLEVTKLPVDVTFPTPSEVRVPTEVNELAVTPLLSVAPVTVPAAAVTVTAAVPSKSTPFMARAVARAVAVAERATATFAVPSNEVPPMVRAVASAVVVAAFPVQLEEEPDAEPVRAPTKVVAVSAAVLEL